MSSRWSGTGIGPVFAVPKLLKKDPSLVEHLHPALHRSLGALDLLPAGPLPRRHPLVAIVLTHFSGRTPKEILSTDALAVFEEFGFREHLTPQRSNGLRSMVERIKTDAREALAAAS